MSTSSPSSPSKGSNTRRMSESLPSCLRLPASAWPREKRQLALSALLSQDGHLPSGEVSEQWAALLAQVVPFRDWLAGQLGQDGEVERIVDVRQVDFKLLQAEVHALRLSEEDQDSEEPSDHGDTADDTFTVSLIDLCPLKDSEAAEADGHDRAIMAERLDHARFFFQNLWLPWDEDEDDCEDWVAEHLDPRMGLWECGPDTKEGARMANLVRQYGALREEMEELKTLRENQEDDVDEADIVASEYLLEQREKELRRDASLLENNELRSALQAKKRSQLVAGRQQSGVEKLHHLVTGPNPLSLADHLAFVNGAQKLIGDKDAQIDLVSSLSTAVGNALDGDVIVLRGEGDEYVESLSEFRGKIVSVKEVKVFCLETPEEASSGPMVEFVFGSNSE